MPCQIEKDFCWDPAVKKAQKRKYKHLEVIFLLLTQCTQVQRTSMYIKEKRKQGCCSYSSSSLSTPKKPIERKQHELQVMARVYCFLTFHLMPTKLIPWFQQVEYVVHRLQLSLHAWLLQTCLKADRRKHLVCSEITLWRWSGRHPRQGKGHKPGLHHDAVRTNGSHFTPTVPSE